jgi:hypothetical protein
MKNLIRKILKEERVHNECGIVWDNEDRELIDCVNYGIGDC